MRNKLFITNNITMAEKIVNYNDITKVKDRVTLNLLKESFDKDFEKQSKVVDTLESAYEASHKGFGYIKESMEMLSSELFKTKEGRSILNRYITCVKESADLKKMHLLFECIRKANKDLDIFSYLNEAVSMVGLVNSEKYHKDTARAGKVLGEAYIYLGKDKVDDIVYTGLDRKNRDLDESVEYIGTHSKNAKTLPVYMEHCQVIKEHVSTHDAMKKLAQFSSKDKDIEKSINEFNEKYGKTLDEEGQSLVRELLNTENKEGVFEKYKNECVDKLREKQKVFENEGDNTSSERLGIILEKVSNKKYNIETVNADVFNLVEIADSLE